MFFNQSRQSFSSNLSTLIQYGFMLVMMLQLFYLLAEVGSFKKQTDSPFGADVLVKDVSALDIVMDCLEAAWRCNISPNIMGMNEASVAFHNETNPNFSGSWIDCADHSLQNTITFDLRSLLKNLVQTHYPSQNADNLDSPQGSKWECYTPDMCGPR